MVILSEESDEDLCSWLPLAARLAAAGYRAVLWDYGGNLPPDELAVLVRALRASGATRIALMGASEGAKASLIAGAQSGPRWRASCRCPPSTPWGGPSSWPGYVRRLRCPLLLVTAREDDFGAARRRGSTSRWRPPRPRAWSPSRAGTTGSALLSGRSATRVLPAVLAFLHRVLGKRDRTRI